MKLLPLDLQSSVPSSFSMKAIIDLQSPDGSWFLEKPLLHFILMGSSTVPVTPPEIFAFSLDQEHRSKAWATVLALWLLETHCAEQKAEWKRVGAKAKRFLKDLGLSHSECLSFV